MHPTYTLERPHLIAGRPAPTAYGSRAQGIGAERMTLPRGAGGRPIFKAVLRRVRWRARPHRPLAYYWGWLLHLAGRAMLR